MEPCIIAGPTCDSADVLYEKTPYPLPITLSVGDEVLKQVAVILKDGCRHIDMVGRYGGEEFLLVFPEAGADSARQICERLRATIEAFDWSSKGAGPRVTMSFGLSTLTSETSYERLIALADERLYEAKEAGRNRVNG